MTSPPLSLLIVEDSPIISERLAALLGRIRGVELIGVAATGAEALSAFAHRLPDAVVLDIGLPDISGLEVLRRLREQTQLTTVIVYTCSTFPEMLQCCALLGANYFFDKSGQVDPVLDALRALVQTRSHLDVGGPIHPALAAAAVAFAQQAEEPVQSAYPWMAC